MTKNVEVYKELIAFHPGSYVEEIIEDLNITQKEFAERLGVSPKTISKIVNAEESISKDTANKLSKLTGISIETWLQLQSTYDIKALEIENQKIEDEKSIINLIDFTYFKKHGFIQSKTYSLHQKIIELRKLLRISNLTYLTQFNQAVSYRNTKGFDEKSIVNSNIMLELATIHAKDATGNKLDRKRLENLLSELREMTLQQPEEFYPVLKEKLLECGVVLVGLPKLTNASLNGATKRFKTGSVLLLMTDKQKYSDVFWFSLFHEIGHIINGDFYSNYTDEEAYREKEDLADTFAKETLINPIAYEEFLRENNVDRQGIITFAESINIHPSIVLGRLQKEGIVDYHQYNDLKFKYNIVIQSFSA
ncbi:HigA family addiction module antidote protein [Streptococcus suis]|nr:HigA family addiction module antidote protein [Streptococcus suis]